MSNQDIIKFDQNLIKRVGNSISITDKLLALNQNEIKVFIANDHILMINGLKKALENFNFIKIVGQAGSLSEVFTTLAIADLLPDILLTDDQMPNTNLVQDLAQIKKLYPNLKIIMWPVIGAMDFLIADYINYINGYLYSWHEVEDYVEIFKKVYLDQNYFIKREFSNGKFIKEHKSGNREQFVSIVKDSIKKN